VQEEASDAGTAGVVPAAAAAAPQRDDAAPQPAAPPPPFNPAHWRWDSAAPSFAIPYDKGWMRIPAARSTDGHRHWIRVATPGSGMAARHRRIAERRNNADPDEATPWASRQQWTG